MATSRIVLGIICYALTGSFGMPDRIMLANSIPDIAAGRQKVITIAQQELGVREKTGHNDGPQVKAYLQIVGLKTGAPWCAAYVSYVFAHAGYAAPRTAWSPALFPVSRITSVALPADVFGIYFPEYHRIAHVGIVERLDGDYCISLEGNTNPGGSNDGDGVYRRRRLLKTLRRFADWVKPERSGP